MLFVFMVYYIFYDYTSNIHTFRIKILSILSLYMDPYLTTQIITYMGNKRKMIPAIQSILEDIRKKENKEFLELGDGFSGSGIVSRLFKQYSSKLYTNDISDYSFYLNKCYLSTLSKQDEKRLTTYIEKANEYANTQTKYVEPFVSGKWAPLEKTIQPNERVFFTFENGKRIDIYRNYIETLPEPYRSFLIGRLLVEVSIHNNTSGQFSAYYKGGNNVGKYGGKHEIDLHRIEAPISLSMPVSHLNNKTEVVINQLDATQWAKSLPPLDLVYYDPPYNKHPYSIYYFLLNIVALWDKSIPVPNTNRGQPNGWHRSAYNSYVHAEKEFEELIKNTNAKYIIISYNNGGIIPLDHMDTILQKHGNVEKIPIEHRTYNRLKGISEYKRKEEKAEIKEFFWLVTRK